MVSDACVHVVSNGASARSVNILSGAAQGAFRDALSLQTKLQAPVQQHRKIYVSLFVITNGCQKCKENVTFFFPFFFTSPDWFLSELSTEKPPPSLFTLTRH